MGGEVHDYKILEALFRQGAYLDILLPRNRAGHSDWPNAYFSKTLLPVPFAFLFNINVAFYLFRLWRRKKFDVLRIHSPYFVGLGALFFRLFHQVPVVATYHHDFQENIFFRWLDKFTAHRWDKIITDSEYSRRKILEFYPKVKPENVAVVYNGAGDLKPGPKNDKLLDELGLRNKKILFFLGRLEQRKNAVFLLEAMAGLPPEVALIIAGDGREKNNLRKKITETNLTERVVLLTQKLTRKEKEEFFNSAHLFVFPSLLEGFGLVAAEAAACGLPAIVANNSSLPEVVEHQKTGLVLDLDVKKWQKAVLDLLADEKRRLAMGRAGRERAHMMFNWDRAAEKTTAIYQEAISRQKKRDL